MILPKKNIVQTSFSYNKKRTLNKYKKNSFLIGGYLYIISSQKRNTKNTSLELVWFFGGFSQQPKNMKLNQIWNGNEKETKGGGCERFVLKIFRICGELRHFHQNHQLFDFKTTFEPFSHQSFAKSSFEVSFLISQWQLKNQLLLKTANLSLYSSVYPMKSPFTISHLPEQYFRTYGFLIPFNCFTITQYIQCHSNSP